MNAECAGHPGDAAVALLSTACVHEHLRVDVPCCQLCIDWMEDGPKCCNACHESSEGHCCPITVTARPLGLEVAQ